MGQRIIYNASHKQYQIPHALPTDITSDQYIFSYSVFPHLGEHLSMAVNCAYIWVNLHCIDTNTAIYYILNERVSCGIAMYKHTRCQKAEEHTKSPWVLHRVIYGIIRALWSSFVPAGRVTETPRVSRMHQYVRTNMVCHPVTLYDDVQQYGTLQVQDKVE